MCCRCGHLAPRPKSQSIEMKRLNVTISVVLFFASSLVLGACGKHEVSSLTRVTLGIFSGRSDPSWNLTTKQSSQLLLALSSLRPVNGNVPIGSLGYHGFTFTTSSRSLLAFNGRVSKVPAKGAWYWNDPRHSIEHLLIVDAHGHVSPQLLLVVSRSLR